MPPHYFYGGEKDGEPILSHCREFILTTEPNETPMDINDFNDPEFAISFKEVKWIHAVYRTTSSIDYLRHYFVREDIFNRLSQRK